MGTKRLKALIPHPLILVTTIYVNWIIYAYKTTYEMGYKKNQKFFLFFIYKSSH